MTDRFVVGKGSLLNMVYSSFVKSRDFNGLSIRDIGHSLLEDLLENLISLVKEEKVCILAESHDENPHIIRWGFLSTEEQVHYLSSYDGKEEVCLYPSPKYLNEKRNVEEFVLQPFKKLMALGFPQLKACYFHYSILLHYALDPNYDFEFCDYQGSIKSTEVQSDKFYIDLETFGIGRNGDETVIVSYPRYLSTMSTMNQFLWDAHQIKDNSNCRVLKQYQDNVLGGCWNFPNTVYSSILQEIENINQQTQKAFNKKIFLKEYSKNKLKTFDILPYPTLDIYYQFLMLLEKVIVSNIDQKFFDDLISTKDELDKHKPSLVCLKEWLQKVKPECIEIIYSPLHKIRNLRQEPAHGIYANNFSVDYLKKQHELTKGVYDSLHSLRLLLSSHPKLKGFKVKYPNTSYIEL